MLLSFYSFPFAQMTAPGSVQSLSGRELKKVTTGEWENGESQTRYISPFSALLRDWVTRVHYCVPELPGRWLYVPPLTENGFFCYKTARKCQPCLQESNYTVSHINMIYQECAMFLYNCLELMAMVLPIRETYTERQVLARNSYTPAVHSQGCRLQ